MAASSIRDLGTSPTGAVVSAAVVSLLLTVRLPSVPETGSDAPCWHIAARELSAGGHTHRVGFRIATSAAGAVVRLAGARMPLGRNCEEGEIAAPSFAA